MKLEESKKEIVTIITKLLKQPHYRIFLFGSRVNGQGSERSDFDIGIEADKQISPRVINDIKTELDNLRTLHKFDVVDFKTADQNFREVALQQVEVLYEK